MFQYGLDDIILACEESGVIVKFVDELKKHLKLRDLGATDFLLSISITRDRPNPKLWLSSKPCILCKLEVFGMSYPKPIGTPMIPHQHLSKAECPTTPMQKDEMQDIPCMAAVGS